MCLKFEKYLRELPDLFLDISQEMVEINLSAKNADNMLVPAPVSIKARSGIPLILASTCTGLHVLGML